MFLRLYTGVTTWWNDLKGRAAEEGGATAVEYALMVALIAVVIIAAVAFVGKSASNQLSTCTRATGPPVAHFPGR
jgi:Flp pilus assembly pilin Flp